MTTQRGLDPPPIHSYCAWMSTDPKDYAYAGAFNQAEFQKTYPDEFKGVHKANMASMPDLLFLLGKVGADPRITDIRWSAYILATAFIESSHTVRITKESVSKKGRVKSHKVNVWRNSSPIEEAGHGKGAGHGIRWRSVEGHRGDRRRSTTSPRTGSRSRRRNEGKFCL
jgi:hypothetical protein